MKEEKQGILLAFSSRGSLAGYNFHNHVVLSYLPPDSLSTYFCILRNPSGKFPEAEPQLLSSLKEYHSLREQEIAEK